MQVFFSGFFSDLRHVIPPAKGRRRRTKKPFALGERLEGQGGGGGNLHFLAGPGARSVPSNIMTEQRIFRCWFRSWRRWPNNFYRVRILAPENYVQKYYPPGQ